MLHKKIESTGDGKPEVLRVPGWERFGWLRAGFSTRLGGLSQVYGQGELNLGFTPEDEPAIVAENRQRFVRAVAGEAALELVTVRQVHGAEVRDLEVEAEPSMTAEGKARLEGDGLMSLGPGRLLGILTADCVPVLVADTRLRAVAAFHAGWRGTVAGIIARGVGRMRDRYGSRPEDLIAAIGPCVGACCFEVGEEVRAAFEGAFGDAPSLFTGGPGLGLRMDLVEANRRQLVEAGMGESRVSAVNECTACARLADGRQKYYSHRGERGFAGRMLSVIGAVPSESA